MKLRIKFRKQGYLRFIGHLDIMRYFQKTIRRAQIPVCYSSGFNPHQIMSFGSPLSVGHVSRAEYMDIEIEDTCPWNGQEIMERLNAQSAEGMEVLSCRILDDGAGNAMSVLAAADFTVWRRESADKQEEIRYWEAAAAFCRRDSIPYIKHGKKGDRELDLAPLIYRAAVVRTPDELEALEDELGCRADRSRDAWQDHWPRLYLRLSQGSSANVKPEQVLEAWQLAEGREQVPFAFQIEREDVYADRGEEGHHDFISLELFGKEF